jgi:hypothetical protein
MTVTSVPQVLGQSQDIVQNSAHLSRVQVFNLSNPAPGSWGNYNVVSGKPTLTINPTDGAFITLLNLTSNLTVNFVGMPGTYVDAYGVTMYRPTVWRVTVSPILPYALTFNNVVWDGGSAPASIGSGLITLLFTSFDGVTINGKLLYS